MIGSCLPHIFLSAISFCWLFQPQLRPTAARPLNLTTLFCLLFVCSPPPPPPRTDRPPFTPGAPVPPGARSRPGRPSSGPAIPSASPVPLALLASSSVYLRQRFVQQALSTARPASVTVPPSAQVTVPPPSTAVNGFDPDFLTGLLLAVGNLLVTFLGRNVVSPGS